MDRFEEAKTWFIAATRCELYSKEWFDLLLKSAAEGYIHAITAIGMAYRDGRGTARNPEEALKWFTLAVGHGDKS